MAIIGTAYVQIRAEDKHFEADVRAAARRIKNVAIQLKADVDMTKASKKIRDLRYRITSKDAVLKIDADVTKADAKMAKLLSKFLENDLEFNAVANTAGADSQLTALRTRFAHTRSTFNADADTGAAEAQLDFAARNRTAKISAKLDPQTTAALKGLFNTLTGTIPYEKIRGTLSAVAANFEAIAVKGTAIVSVIGGISAEILTAGANILSVGGDISEAVGLIALMPTAMGSMVTIMGAMKMAWTNFGKAFNKDAKKSAAALAELPKEAQNTVKALKGVYAQIQKPVQKAFWVSMGTSLQDTVKRLLPALTDGFVKVGGSLGTVTKEVSLAFGRLGDGTLQKMFEHLAGFLDNLAPGMGRLIDAFNILGKVGATYLPQFGTYLTSLATQFKGFIENAEKTGKINEWIETGTKRLQEMGSIVKSTTGIFGGLVDASRRAGAPGLTEMAASLRDIRDLVNGEPFQSRLTTVLEGARTGAAYLGEAFSDLAKFVGDSSTAIGIFLTESSVVVSKFIGSIKTLFDGTGLGSGLITAMDGMATALDILQPGFADLGSSIGNLGIISGEVFKGMAPGLNQLFDTIDKVIESIKQGVIDALPVFNTFMQALLGLAQGPIVALATGVGNLLTAFSKLPAAIQTVMMSIGLFLLLKKGFDKFFGGLGKSLQDETTNAGKSFGQVRRGAAQMRGGVRDAFATMGASAKNFGVALSEGVGKSFSPLVGRAQDMADKMKGAMQQAGAGFRQGVNLGPYLDGVKRGLGDVATRTKQTISGMGDQLKGVGKDLARSLVPAGSALDNFGKKIKDTASQVHNNLQPARDAFKALGPAALTAGKNLGANLGAGLKQAGGGLMSALGGGWGLALMGATMAIGLFADSQAKAESKVASLAGALDEQSAAFTGAAKKMLAADVLDQDANWFDDLMRSGRRNMEELVRDTGMNMDQVMETLSNPQGRDEFVNNFKKIRDATGEGNEVTQELAASVNMTTDNFKGLSQTDLNEMTKQIEDGANSAKKAEERVLALAQATGKTTVQATILARNFDTLKSSTSSVSEKFAALKQNLDVAGDGMASASTNALGFAKSVFDLEDGIKSIGGEYDHWEENQTKFSESFKKGLLDINGQWNTTSRGAVAFGQQMDGARDAVLQSGAAELKRLQDTGMKFPEAAAGALKVMNDGAKQVRTTLEKAGLDVGTVNTIMANLKLNPENLKAAVAVDTKDAESKLLHLEIMKAGVMSGNWEVALTASSKQVQDTILGTDRMREAYKNGGWEAVATLKDDTGKSMGELMTKIALAKDDSEVEVLLKAAFPDSHVFDEAKQKAKEYGMMDVKAALGVEDNATAPTELAKKAIEEYNLTPTLDKYLKGVDLTGPATESAKATMSALPDVTRKMEAQDATEDGKNQAAITMNQLNDVTRKFFGDNQTQGGKDSATGTMESLKSVTRDLSANDAAAPGRNAAQGTIDALRGKEVKLTADDQASGVVGAVDRQTIGNKTFTVSALWDAASFAIKHALGFANGGIMKNNVQTFANGGILSKAVAPAVKAYANGGIENHVAQIAYKSAAVPMRIWAEAEGGEAYIPLALSKRKRSLEILRQVMAEFGLEKYAMFADGGFNNKPVQPSVVKSRHATTTSAVSPAAHGGAGTQINFTVNPSQGLSEAQIGESAMKELYWQIASR